MSSQNSPPKIRENAPERRHARSDATKNSLKRAAETLIAEHGVENISIRDIVLAAEQKNESALQYHFKNLSGLLQAIHQERGEQIQQKRAELLAARLEYSDALELRDLSSLMVAPAFELARDDPQFRRYVKAFGHKLALSDSSAIKYAGSAKSAQELGQLLRDALPHLDEKDYKSRLAAAIRLSSASMHQQALQKNAFRGMQADLFFQQLIDALFGLLSGPVSLHTKALKETSKTSKSARQRKD